MDKIEEIRAEIERHIKHYEKLERNDFRDGELYICQELLDFIDTLSEESDKSLEDAAKEYCKTIFHKPFSENPQEEHIVYEQDKYNGFIAGAKWQAEQDDRDVVFWEGMQHAIAGMKEDAVEGIYTKSMDGKNVFVESGALKIDPASVKVGDPVKLIIIKDDGKSD